MSEILDHVVTPSKQQNIKSEKTTITRTQSAVVHDSQFLPSGLKSALQNRTAELMQSLSADEQSSTTLAASAIASRLLSEMRVARAQAGFGPYSRRSNTTTALKMTDTAIKSNALYPLAKQTAADKQSNPPNSSQLSKLSSVICKDVSSPMPSNVPSSSQNSEVCLWARSVSSVSPPDRTSCNSSVAWIPSFPQGLVQSSPSSETEICFIQPITTSTEIRPAETNHLTTTASRPSSYNGSFNQYSSSLPIPESGRCSSEIPSDTSSPSSVSAQASDCTSAYSLHSKEQQNVIDCIQPYDHFVTTATRRNSAVRSTNTVKKLIADGDLASSPCSAFLQVQRPQNSEFTPCFGVSDFSSPQQISSQVSKKKAFFDASHQQIFRRSSVSNDSKSQPNYYSASNSAPTSELHSLNVVYPQYKQQQQQQQLPLSLSNFNKFKPGGGGPPVSFSPSPSNFSASSQSSFSPSPYPWEILDTPSSHCDRYPPREAVVEFIRGLLQPLYNSGQVSKELFVSIIKAISVDLFSQAWKADDEGAWQQFLLEKISALLESAAGNNPYL